MLWALSPVSRAPRVIICFNLGLRYAPPQALCFRPAPRARSGRKLNIDATLSDHLLLASCYVLLNLSVQTINDSHYCPICRRGKPDCFTQSESHAATTFWSNRIYRCDSASGNTLQTQQRRLWEKVSAGNSRQRLCLSRL